MGSLRSAGVKFVGRYISSLAINDTNGKNLIPEEKTRILAAGISIIIYCEEGTTIMKGGHDAGVAVARHAVSVASALGLDGIPFYYAADFDAAPSDQPAINSFLDGTASVHGEARNGIYGGYYVVKRCLDSGKARYAVQTIAWSSCPADFVPPAGTDKVAIPGNGHRLFDQRAQIRQTVGTSIDGVSCDLLEAHTADYGQWPRPASVVTPKPPVAARPHLQQEEEMIIRASDPTYAVAFGNGQWQWISFFADNSVQGKPTQHLRVAPWSADNGGEFAGIEQDIGVDVDHEKVTVQLPAHCAGISVQRKGQDTDWCPVAFNLGPLPS
jgi:hypothetical protein